MYVICFSSVEWIAVCPQRTSLLQVWHGSFRKDGWRYWECPMWRMTRVRFLLESNIKDDKGTVSQKSLSWNARNFSLLSFNAGVSKSLSWNAANLYMRCFVFIRQLKELVGHVQYLMQKIVFNPVIDQVRGFSTNYSDTQHLLLYPNKTNSPILACLHKTDKKKWNYSWKNPNSWEASMICFISWGLLVPSCWKSVTGMNSNTETCVLPGLVPGGRNCKSLLFEMSFSDVWSQFN